MYVFSLNFVPLPIPPSSLEIKTPSMNKTVTLINDGEINIPKNKGLREISFEFLLPAVNCYPFAQYNLGMPGLGNYTASALIPLLTWWRDKNKPTRFLVARLSPDYKPIYYTNILCLIEDFSFKEDAEEYGFDTMCSITLKEYKHYGTKRLKANAPDTKPGSNKASVEKTRDTSEKSQPKNIKTKKNETIITGSRKTGDGLGITLDSNDIKIPDSITNSSGENWWMEEILPDVDLEKISDYEQHNKQVTEQFYGAFGAKSNPWDQGRVGLPSSLADAVLTAPSKTTYARPTVPSNVGTGSWKITETGANFIKDFIGQRMFL